MRTARWLAPLRGCRRRCRQTRPSTRCGGGWVCMLIAQEKQSVKTVYAMQQHDGTQMLRMHVCVYVRVRVDGWVGASGVSGVRD